jgi:NAD(P)H-dependent FMN reductase
MRILGIVGSPNKDGLTNRLVQRVLRGVCAAGGEAETMLLSAEDIRPCRGCRVQTCWDDGICRLDETAEARNQRIKRADGVVFGAPVYFHDINGLAKDFIDKVRIPPRGGGLHSLFLPTNGKPALAITIAGGTGKGALTSLGAIHWGFFLPCGFRALPPVAATRFNLDQALRECEERGRALAEAAREIIPFEPQGLADRISYFQGLDRVNSDFTDDNLFLAEAMLGAVQDLPGAEQDAAAIRSDIEKAKALIAAGRKSEAPFYTARAYETGRRRIP